ncbi:MAG: iron ABC transporter permease, partial [Fretibacterium sp.]|nr:iron ABC transporter permease [Fretibacterium sp.]
LCIPALFSSFLIVFIKSISDFGNPQLLGGDFSTLSSQAYLQINGMYDTRTGSLIAISILLPSVTAFLIERYWISRKSFVTVTGKPQNATDRPRVRALDRACFAVCFLLTVVILMFYGTVLLISLVKTWGVDMSLSFNNFITVFDRGKIYIKDSLVLSLIAMPLTTLVAMVISYLLIRKKFYCKRLIEFTSMLTFAVPGIVLGIGYIIAFNKRPFLLTGTAAVIVIALMFRNMSIGIEAGENSLRQIDPSIEEAATDLGADSATVFRTVVLPLVRPAFLSSLSYTFVRSMTAVSAVIFLISARWYHLTVLIYNFSENLRFGLASVLSTVLIVIVFGAFGLMRLLVRENENLMKNVT